MTPQIIANGPWTSMPERVVGPTRALPNKFITAKTQRMISVAQTTPRGERGNAAKIPKAMAADTTNAVRVEIHSSPVILE